MSEYFVDEKGRITKKKKKSQTDYAVNEKGKITKNEVKEDIAPVKSTKKTTKGGKKDSWFKSGAFSDGVDGVGDFFGDLGKSIVGTVGDVGVGLGKGLTRLGEGVVDATKYGVAGVADLTGNDDYADKVRKSAIKNDTDKIWKKAEKKVDKWSVLGNKSDAVTEGLGQVAGIVLTGGVAGALGAGAGVATAITTGTVGVSGMGSGISQAYQDGATDKEAYTYGTIAGTGEALTELLFGGLGKTVKAVGLSKGLSSADDMLAKKVSGMFSNQIAKNFAEYGIKAGAEGTEEVLSGIVSAVGKKVTYMEEEELQNILKDENLLEQFVVGSITSGIAQSGAVPGMTQGSLIEANKKGTDFITGLTVNEQKVVDKEFENRISEAEKDGKKLDKNEKNKIYDEVLNDLDKGYISTDTIESALGNKTYETYKSMEEQENTLKKEIESLENTPKEQFTVKQDERLKELREELAKIDKTQVKNQLSSEVSELAKVDRLNESYNEKTRRSEAFKADLTKYDTKQQEVIKRATESGILNNTNRTHEFVDMVAKISADKGVLFDFTNNQKLKESGFAVEGKTVNGYVKDGNIAVNIDSNKSLNTIVGHEITHVLEGTELYTELQEAVKNYATTKGDYDTRIKELSELYKDVKDANIEGEVTADLVGDYLFTDKDFINNLSTEQPNIFKKIYNEIKYLYKMATAGSKEARQLEKVKRTFENAYKQNISKNSDTKHSFSGTRAKTANSSLFLKADRMLDAGVDSETVRQETGWFKGYDGKMRFEIDDSQMEVYPNGDATFRKAHPEYVELEELKKKKDNSGITAEELDRLNKLDNIWGREANRWNELLRRGNLQLENILEHDKLYASYPELKDIDIEIASSEDGFKGQYNRKDKTITINEKLLDGDIAEVKKTLIHEIQHAIQHLEGFSRGSSPEYWQDRIDDGEVIQTKEQKAELTELRKQYEDVRENEPEFFKEMNELEEMTPTVSRGAIDWDTLEQIEEDPIEWQNFDKQRETLEQKYGDEKVSSFMFLNHKIKNREERGISAYEAYRKTAGEIEARDTANRLSLNEEQRKATRPDIDKEDVVYSDNAKYSLSDNDNKNIKVEVNEFYGGEMFATMSYTQDGKTVGTIEYSEYDGKPNVKMIEVEPEYRRKGIATKLLQELQKKYPDAEINYGMTTPDGSKLLKSITYDVTDKTVVADKQKLQNLQTELNDLQERLDVLYDIENPTAEQETELRNLGDRWNEVYDNIRELESALKGKKATKTFVKTDTKYSLSDSDGKTLTKEQQEYFKDSKVRDENGNLKVMYHGTSNGGHTVFDTYGSNFGLFGQGTYFTDNKSVAESYTDKGKGNNKQVYEAYLNIKNPMDMDAQANVEEWQKAFPEADFSSSKTNEDCFKAMKEYFFDNEYTKNEAYEEALDAITGMGYDGLTHIGGGRFNKADDTRHRVYIAYEPEQIKNIDNTKPTDNADINLSMTNKGQNIAPYGNYNVYGKDIALEQAPVQEVAPVQETTETVQQNNQAIDYAPLTEEQANERDAEQSLTSMESEEFEKVVQSYMDDAPAYMFDEDEIRAWAEEQARQNPQGATPKESTVIPESPLEERDIEEVGNRKIKAYMYENPEVKPFFQEEAQNMLLEYQYTTRGERLRQGSRYGLDEYEIGASNEGWYGTKRHTSKDIAYLRDELKIPYDKIEKGLRAIIEDHGAENNAVSKRIEFILDERLREGYTDFIYGQKILPNQDYINLLNEKQITEYNDEAFNNWVQTLKDEDIPPETMQEDVAPFEESIEQVLYSLEESKNKELSEIDTKLEEVENAEEPELSVDESFNAKIENYKNAIEGYNTARTEIETAFDDAIQKKTNEYEALKRKDTKKASDLLMQIENLKLRKANNLSNIDSRIDKSQTRIDNMIKNSESVKQGMYGRRRKTLHNDKMNEIKSMFSSKGFDFDKVLRNAKNKSTFASVDNTPQRFMEKTLGYKEGQTLADLTVNKVAQNESEGIQWVNQNVGLLKQISKEYGIKPRSKESASAQMYAEGFYADENGDLVAYGDKELEADFEDARVRENIKKLANDPRIRSIYDETLDQINKSRTRNAYPEIPKRDNYFMHFIEMDDAFSRLGIPFNPNDIRAKDLPTDINGMTVDLKPGQPYFASAMQRKGYKTTYDLLGGVERYLNSAKNQIFHIDDIQTLRATRNYIADMFGQAKGLEDLDSMTETEASERIEQVFGSHLSNFAKFLHEEANVIAGKTALIDRGIEGIVGRRGISFLNTLNGQVGSNMVGFNVSSSLTNLISVMQSMAKSSKIDTLKAFTQTASNKIGSIFGRTDGFADNNPAIIRRKGIDTFARKPYEKISDKGYVLMSAIDDISTEIITRTKFNELTRKGMSEEQAHIESDKWASRILGDRSLGQQPLLYNSKMLGLITKFQLEVRNQLDSQFYDTIQDAKVSTEDIDNAIARNAVKSAKVASTLVQLAVLQHVFGKAFESVAGYNPAFDIIEVLMTTFGFDDEEDSEDTSLDNLEQGFLALMEDMPYSSVLTGGRIPISSALPIKELIKGEDSYGREKPRLETLKEVAPYYLMPTGYGQIKKTMQGLDMFSDEHPVSGSYTDSGDLRFPIEDTTKNRIQAGLFGQYANENARYYFDNNIAPLNKKQTQEYIDVEMPIKDYWNYRDEMKGKKKIEDKADYISNLDIPVDKKNILINNATTRKEPIDLTDYEDYSDFNEFDFATKNPEKYEFLMQNNVSYEDYSSDKKTKEAYNWAFKNPEEYTLSKAVSKDVVTYRKRTKKIYNIKADKDRNGKSIIGSRKEKVANYINGLDADYGEKLILFKSEYNADDTYNYEIIDYLNSREDITFDEMNTILKQLGFKVTTNGDIYWD